MYTILKLTKQIFLVFYHLPLCTLYQAEQEQTNDYFSQGRCDVKCTIRRKKTLVNLLVPARDWWARSI